MKSLFIVACAGLLCSCASGPVVQGSINGYGYASAPTSASDPRLLQPRFYLDEGDSMPWLKQVPRTNR